MRPGKKIATYTDKGLDIPVLYEIFVAGTYEGNYQGMKVLDVGAYRGESSIFFALRGASQVLCVEPSPSAAPKIRENLILSGYESQIKFLPLAVGAEAGVRSFLLTDDEASYSHLSSQTIRSGDHIARIQVQVRSLEQILDEVGWKSVDVAKVDCEGCEYAIFSTTPPEILRRVKVWIIETHKGEAPIVQKLQSLRYSVEFQSFPDGLGYVRAWLSDVFLPWDGFVVQIGG